MQCCTKITKNYLDKITDNPLKNYLDKIVDKTYNIYLDNRLKKAAFN